MKQPQPVLHTPEQEAQIRDMINPVLDVIEKEYGVWGLDCVRDFCRGRMEELAKDIHRTR